MSLEHNALIAEVARRHGLGESAARALWQALVVGRGVQAQFAHPELGGMGQWSGGMVQIGDMFNAGLKAKVMAACAELAPAAALSDRDASAGAHRRQRQSEGGSRRAELPAAGAREGEDAWWPPYWGQPSSTGAQNECRYAVFPDRRRLVVRQGGRVTIYDTGDHRILGVSQRQSAASALAFTSQSGPVMLDTLPVVGE